MAQASNPGICDPAEPTTQVVRAMYQIASRLRRETSATAVSGQAAVLLDVVTHLGPSRASDIAGHIGVDLSTVSRQVQALEQHGFLRRTPDPSDGRAALVELTDTGRAELGLVWSRRIATLRGALETWSPEDQAALGGLMERLAGTLGELHAHEHVTHEHATHEHVTHEHASNRHHSEPLQHTEIHAQHVEETVR